MLNFYLFVIEQIEQVFGGVEGQHDLCTHTILRLTNKIR